MKETSIEQIFKEFDFDESGGLSRDEVFEMFNGFGISITLDDLNKLYDSVEVNL
jgi:Ca2+-binding EF-hand superfamily protein